MLVQTCPVTTSTLGSYSGAASYCGLTLSAQSDSNYADTNNVINDRVACIPIVVENTSVASDANGNSPLIQSNKCGADTAVNNSDIFDDNSFESVDTKDHFLKIDTDTIETESQMLNIETTITETFIINSNEIVDDIISELIESQPNENSSDKNSVSNHSLNESEVVEQQSIHTGANIEKSTINYDFYSQNFERAFQLESTGIVPISSVSPSLSSDSSLCHKVLRSREPSPTLNKNKREFERDSDTRSTASQDRGSSDTDEVQKKSCLDKSVKAKEVFSSPDGEKSSGHRVTFNDKNEVASQDKDGKFKVTYRQLGEKIKNHAESGQSGEHKKAALKVQYGEKSRLESVPISPRTLNFNDTTFDLDMNQAKDSCESCEMPEEWDNPFQPEGEVSQDADLILQLWKGGKLNEDNLEENLKNLAAAASAESSITSSPEHSNHKGLNGFNDRIGVNNVMNNDDKNGVNGANGVNGVNGVNSANGEHLVFNSKPGSPKKNTSQIPVLNNIKENNSDMTYTVVLSDKQKHKNKIKKHCNMM